MDNSKRNVHNSGPLGRLVNSGGIFKVEENTETKSISEDDDNNKAGYFKTQSGIDFKDNELVIVDPEECKPWEFANRLHDDFGNLEELKTSIKENTQLQPVLLRNNTGEGTEKYEVIFGRRRHLACKELKIKLIAIIKPELSNSDALRYQHIENEFRKNVSDFSNALLYQKLLDNKHYKSQRELAEVIGVPKSTINDLLKFNKIDNDIISLIPNIHNLSRNLVLKIVSSLQEGEETKNIIKQIAPFFGVSINTENNLLSALKKGKGQTTRFEAIPPKVIKDSDNKRLFTLRQNHRGEFSINFNTGTIKEDEIKSLCSCIKSFIAKEELV